MNPELSADVSPQNLASRYKKQEIGMSSPEKCVLHLYDAAIKGCALKQSEQAGNVLAMLIDTLNFSAGGDVANALFSLYEYCLRMVHQQQFENPQKILKDLRETWHRAITEQQAT